MKKKVLLILLIILILSLAVKAQTKTIEIKDLKYDPSELTIKQGMTVKWINKDSAKTHQVYETYNRFPRSPILFPQERYNYTFTEIGEFEYRDAAKPSRMIGHITVVSEEDYVEEVNETEQTINITTNQTTTNEIALNTTNQNLTGVITLEESTDIDQPTKSTEEEEEKEEEPITLTTQPREKLPRIWWTTAIILIVVVGLFLIGKQFIIIKPIEVREELRKSKKEFKPSEKKEHRAKILKIEDNVIELKCPHCSNKIKTIFSRPGPINLVCDSCGANISAKVKES